jgi:hypothetical protein
MRKAIALAGLMGVLLVVSSCGDKDEGKDALAASACTAAATTGSVSLPSGFPTPSGVTYTASTTAGPTTITSGSATGDLGDVYDAYKKALDQAPYSVTKSEKEKDDAEVNFESDTVTGQVKLRDCDSKTAVQVTARPK